MDEIRNILQEFSDMIVTVKPIEVAGSGHDNDIEFVILGPDVELPGKISDEAVREVRKIPGFVVCGFGFTSR